MIKSKGGITKTMLFDMNITATQIVRVEAAYFEVFGQSRSQFANTKIEIISIDGKPPATNREKEK